MLERRIRIRIRPVLAWYDLWIGAYVDRARRRVYVFPLPCIGLVIEHRPREARDA